MTTKNRFIDLKELEAELPKSKNGLKEDKRLAREALVKLETFFTTIKLDEFLNEEINKYYEEIKMPRDLADGIIETNRDFFINILINRMFFGIGAPCFHQLYVPNQSEPSLLLSASPLEHFTGRYQDFSVMIEPRTCRLICEQIIAYGEAEVKDDLKHWIRQYLTSYVRAIATKCSNADTLPNYQEDMVVVFGIRRDAYKTDKSEKKFTTRFSFAMITDDKQRLLDTLRQGMREKNMEVTIKLMYLK